MSQRRLIDGDDAGNERLAHHLRQIDAPQPLSPAALARIRRQARTPSSGRHWRWLVPALAAAALLAWIGRRPAAPMPSRPSPPSHAVVVTQLPAPPPPPAAEKPPAPLAHARPTPDQRLQSGPLMVRAGDEPTFVEVPGGRVRVPPHGVARLEVRGYSVRIAAYRGRVSVTSATETFLVDAGADTTRVLAATPPPPPEPAPPTADGAAAELVARALKLLRVDHDRAAALRLLDEHDRRFPSSLLDQEVARLRKEAQ
jgi:hypothetical protein